MKKAKLYFSVVFLLIILKANGQIYHGFPTVDGYWKTQYSWVGCLDTIGISGVCSEYQYIITGDTSIGNDQFQKIELSGRDRNPNDETWTYWNSGYHGCYRNDLEYKKVYYIPKDSIYESLLYDFNLNLFDTLPESFIYHQAENMIVTVEQIDSILIQDTYLKRYHLSENAGFGGEYLIEGIGNTLGLLSQITPFFEHMYDLLCFKNYEDNLYYFDNDSSDCDLITRIIEITQEDFYLQIYPNPAKDFIIIDNEDIGKGVIIEIYNSVGQKVKTITDFRSNSIINIADLQNGLYFVRINLNGLCVKTEKIIKK